MEFIGLNDLREKFLKFYEGKNHLRHESFSLVPEKEDKSLLIVNSGMAPLKPYFAGLKTPPALRMTTCQKCIRTGDIDNVGLTARHATFFEMLGSFSFGDYFKKESIQYGWEFMTDVLKLPEDKLWATIYEDDDEAYDIWKNDIGLNPEKIVRLGKEDNFWEIGTGPCGPCSEIYFDRGEEYACDSADCKPGCECDRYIEFWNHVFTQFNKDANGEYTLLEKKNIDTGMGLERLACIIQSVDSIFDVDTIRYILDYVVELSGVPYQSGKAKTDTSIRIITDHIRSVVFMISDDILPSNEMRGYVLRRLLRRAARHARLIGIKSGELAKIADKVIDISSGAYKELEQKREYIKKIITIEEEKFESTIEQGNNLLNEEIKSIKGNKLSGEIAFKLYDTYGFPIELTEEILAEHGYSVDMGGFLENMEKQKEAARKARKATDTKGWDDSDISYSHLEKTEFTGYDELKTESKILAIFPENTIVFDKTPFYAERGGQVSDIGVCYNEHVKAEISNVTVKDDIFFHKLTVGEGSLEVGQTLILEVDYKHRNAVSINHSATHLLHTALKKVIGEHVNQAGSYVDSEGLRFDFSHFEALTKEEIFKIEKIVNEQIISFLPIEACETDMESAMEKGAIAQFDDKYGDKVRVVSMGDFSVELCGGTHLKNTGQIGSFKIVSESGIAAGTRRIEAITSFKILEELKNNEQIIDDAAEILKVNNDQLLNKINNVNEELKILKKESKESKLKALSDDVDSLIKDAYEQDGIKLIRNKYINLESEELRTAADKIRDKAENAVILLITENSGKLNFLLTVTEDLLDKGYHAGKLIKEIAAAANGKGGGKADMAQAGGGDAALIDKAFETAKEKLFN